MKQLEIVARALGEPLERAFSSVADRVSPVEGA